MMSSDPSNYTNLTWRTARRCDGGTCVQVAVDKGMVLIRDSKNPNGSVLVYSRADWANFVGAVKKGRRDIT